MKCKIALCLFVLVIISGCEASDGIYSCSYEERHTGCGAKGWTDWEQKCENINMDNYKEGWTPEQVCNKYSTGDTNCSPECCIYVEYQNNELSKSACNSP